MKVNDSSLNRNQCHRNEVFLFLSLVSIKKKSETCKNLHFEVLFMVTILFNKFIDDLIYSYHIQICIWTNTNKAKRMQQKPNILLIIKASIHVLMRKTTRCAISHAEIQRLQSTASLLSNSQFCKGASRMALHRR